MTMENLPDYADVERSVQECYSTWGDTYYRDYYGPDAAYPPVHLPLITSLVDQANPARLLDAGCGPASMLRHLARPGRDLFGFDLTAEMITEARRVMASLGISASLWQGSVLDRGAFKCAPESADTYDTAICVGVFPHLREDDEACALRNLYDCIGRGGTVIVEARNELFSLFTLNRYSHQFFLDCLIPVKLLNANAGDEAARLRGAVDQLGSMFRTDLPPIRRGKENEPGYDEVVSRLHNPLVLSRKFEAVGFASVRTLFYHFHCLPPIVSDHVPKLFREQSLAMEAHPDDWRGYFMASAFCIVAKKP